MAGYRALAAVGRSVVALLNRRFEEEIPEGAGRRPLAVLAGPLDFEKVDTAGAVIRYPAVSVYCYRLSIDRETRAGWGAVSARDGLPRLPLRMHMMMAAWDQFVEAELEWLGLTARTLESEGILTGPLLDPSGDWEPGDMVQVVSDELAMDSLSEAFQAMSTDYRLCLPYLARVVRIDGPRGPVPEEVTTVATRLSGIPR